MTAVEQSSVGAGEPVARVPCRAAGAVRHAEGARRAHGAVGQALHPVQPWPRVLVRVRHQVCVVLEAIER